MHEPWEEMIPFYIAGTLSKLDTARLERHLAGCAQCSRSLVEWQAIAGEVRAQAASQLGALPPLGARVLGAAHQSSPGRAGAQPAYAGRVSPTSITLIAAVFTVVLLGGLMTLLVLRGVEPQKAGVALLPTDTSRPPTSTALPATMTPSVTPTSAQTLETPQIIVIEPSATPVSPEPTLTLVPSDTPAPTRVPPTRTRPTPVPTTRPFALQPTAVLPPTEVPTEIPTEVPTEVPTEPPTEAPSEATPEVLSAAPLLAAQTLRTGACTLRATYSTALLYARPDASAPAIMAFTPEDELAAIARSDNGWYQARYPDGGAPTVGWVQQGLVDASGGCDGLPMISAATPTDTALPVPTFTPTPGS